MASLFDYVKWRGDITFDQIPLNDVDALILSHLSYSLWDGLLSESFEECKTLEKLADDFGKEPDCEQRKKIGYLINKDTADLMFECAVSPRFKDVKICGYRSVFNEENVEQFAGMTFLAGDKTLISYRGTDDSLLGWKEDFNLVWQKPIPAQRDALEYLNAAAEYFKGNLILIGHSKGANLVMNTAVECSAEIRSRFEKLYNFDGPGFPKEFFKTHEYAEIEPKLINVYPEFSVVGMCFRHPKKFIIAKSTGFAVMQHDAMTWQVMGSKFDEADGFKDESKFFYKSFNKWIDNLTQEQTKKFVTALWDVIEASEVKSLLELQSNSIVCTARMLGKLSSLDKETKKEVHKILGILMSVIRSDSPFAKLANLRKEQQAATKSL